MYCDVHSKHTGLIIRSHCDTLSGRFAVHGDIFPLLSIIPLNQEASLTISMSSQRK